MILPLPCLHCSLNNSHSLPMISSAIHLQLYHHESLNTQYSSLQQYRNKRQSYPIQVVTNQTGIRYSPEIFFKHSVISLPLSRKPKELALPVILSYAESRVLNI